MKKWQVTMTDTAKGDLREIALGIYEVSKDADMAVNFIREIEEQCRVLESYPESGAVPKDHVLKALGFRFLVYKHYLVFYIANPTEQDVCIHAVFNEKLDYFRYMRKRI